MSIPMYDPSVEDLVRVFLSDENLDSEPNVQALASLVQTCIEDFIAAKHDSKPDKGELPAEYDDQVREYMDPQQREPK